MRWHDAHGGDPGFHQLFLEKNAVKSTLFLVHFTFPCELRNTQDMLIYSPCMPYCALYGTKMMPPTSDRVSYAIIEHMMLFRFGKVHCVMLNPLITMRSPTSAACDFCCPRPRATTSPSQVLRHDYTCRRE
jgi:hypothetical protein